MTKIRPVGLKRAFAMSFNDCVHVTYGYKRTIVEVETDVEIIRISKKKKKQSTLNGFVQGIAGAQIVLNAKKRARKVVKDMEAGCTASQAYSSNDPEVISRSEMYGSGT